MSLQFEATGGLLSCIPEYAQLPVARGHTNMGVAAKFKAPSLLEQQLDRLPVRLCAVLDTSASMTGYPLQLVKAVTVFTAQQLNEWDSFSLVSFDTRVTEHLPLSSMNQQRKGQAERVINSMFTGGGTNISGGISQGIQLFATVPEITKQFGDPAGTCKEPVDVLFLFTDGQANCGITDEDQLATHITELLKSHKSATGRQIKIHTFGFSKGHNPQLLQTIAEAGNGEYFYISSMTEIATAFATALGGVLSVCIQSLELTISPAAGVRVVSVQTHFETNQLYNGDHRVIIGDLYSEEQKDLIITLSIPPKAATASDQDVPLLLIVTATYVDVNSSARLTSSVPVRVPFVERATLPSSHAEVLLQRNRIITADAMKQAMQAASSGSMHEARSKLDAAANTLRNGPQGPAGMTSAMLNDLKSLSATCADQATYSSRAGALASTYQAYSKQRAASSVSQGSQMMAPLSSIMTSLSMHSSAHVSASVGPHLPAGHLPLPHNAPSLGPPSSYGLASAQLAHQTPYAATQQPAPPATPPAPVQQPYTDNEQLLQKLLQDANMRQQINSTSPGEAAAASAASLEQGQPRRPFAGVEFGTNTSHYNGLLGGLNGPHGPPATQPSGARTYTAAEFAFAAANPDSSAPDSQGKGCSSWQGKGLQSLHRPQPGAVYGPATAYGLLPAGRWAPGFAAAGQQASWCQGWGQGQQDVNNTMASGAGGGAPAGLNHGPPTWWQARQGFGLAGAPGAAGALPQQEKQQAGYNKLAQAALQQQSLQNQMYQAQVEQQAQMQRHARQAYMQQSQSTQQKQQAQAMMQFHQQKLMQDAMLAQLAGSTPAANPSFVNNQQQAQSQLRDALLRQAACQQNPQGAQQQQQQQQWLQSDPASLAAAAAMSSARLSQHQPTVPAVPAVQPPGTGEKLGQLRPGDAAPAAQGALVTANSQVVEGACPGGTIIRPEVASTNVGAPSLPLDPDCPRALTDKGNAGLLGVPITEGQLVAELQVLELTDSGQAAQEVSPAGAAAKETIRPTEGKGLEYGSPQYWAEVVEAAGEVLKEGGVGAEGAAGC